MACGTSERVGMRGALTNRKGAEHGNCTARRHFEQRERTAAAPTLLEWLAFGRECERERVCDGSGVLVPVRDRVDVCDGVAEGLR